MMAMINKTKNPTPTPIPTVIGIPIYKDKLLESGNHRCLHSMLQFHGIRFTERKVMIHGNYNEPRTAKNIRHFDVLYRPLGPTVSINTASPKRCSDMLPFFECMPMPL